MKKYISILMIALVVLSCSKSDDDKDVVPALEHKIVGKWKLNAEIDDNGGYVWEEIDGWYVEYSSDRIFESFSPTQDQLNNIRKYEITDTHIIFFNPQTNEEMNRVSYEINLDNELIIDYGAGWLLIHRFNRVEN
ncbi:hypothetical protein [Bizionia sp.]|uniref:hypothetical protein n=2 Tax=Bizionia sp. TaxID=1954480 RepID=UPI003A94A395